MAQESAQTAGSQALPRTAGTSSATLLSGEGRFRTIFENAGVGMIELDADWRILSANAEYAKIAGRSVTELIGMHCLQFTYPDDIQRSQEALEALVSGGAERISFEKRYVRPDGRVVWVRSNLSLIAGSGDDVRLLKVVEDIDEAKAAEIALAEANAALRESEQRFRNMADHAPVMMWMTDQDGRCTYLNRSWYEFTGQTEDEALGIGWIGAVHPDHAAETERVFLEANARHEPFRIEYRLRRHDGEYRWALDAASPRVGPQGEFLGYIGSVFDIDERKRFEALQVAQTNVLQLALEASSLKEPLDGLVRVIEEESGGQALGSILLLDADGKHLRHGAAPSLPEAYNEAIDGVEIGESVGSCGTAAFRRAAVFVDDVASDPLWADFRDLALEHGLRACWSIPIMAASGEVLGTFAVYYREPRSPTERDLRLVNYVTRTASLIIERSRANAALRKRSEEFYTLADNIPALAWMAYADGSIFWYNRRWYEYTGTDPESQKGWGWESVHDPAALADVTARWKHSIATGEPFEMTFPLRRADGAFRPFLTRVVPIRDTKGNIARWFGTNVDVTDQVRAEEKAREQQRTLETLNRIGSAIAGELDLERVVQLVTDEATKLTGARFGAFFYNVINRAGESYMLYTLSGAQRSQFDSFGMPRNTAVFHPTFAGEGPVRSDDIRKDPRYGKNAPHHGMPKGHLPVVSYLAIPVIGRSGEVMGGLFFGHDEPAKFTENHETLLLGIAGQAAVAIDKARLYREAQREIENRMKAEQAVRMLNETLESRVAEEVTRRTRTEEALAHLQKMETIGQLSGGIAHDFNNLLQVIHGNLSLLKTAVDPEDAKLQRWTGNALLGADRAAALTQRLLAFSRRQPLAPRAVDSNRLIAGMTDLLVRTLGEEVEFAIDLQAGLWLAEVDPNQLENAILNLAVNARDAMPGGGKMTVETRNFLIDQAYAEQNPGTTTGDFVVICVSDEGEGMSAETLERAVEPFFTTKEVGRGTGLGLSMVFGFAQQSGGHLRIYSEPGQGTTAKIYLPRHRGPGTHVVDDRQGGELLPGKGETILLCEDDEEVRQFSADTLRGLGYEVVEAADARAALALLRKNDKIELLFSDVVLPGGMTGVDLAREAKALRPGLKILYTSGYARSALYHQGRLETGVELIPKPFSIADLSARLRVLLD